jgi:hypothetical protein
MIGCHWLWLSQPSSLCYKPFSLLHTSLEWINFPTSSRDFQEVIFGHALILFFLILKGDCSVQSAFLSLRARPTSSTTSRCHKLIISLHPSLQATQLSRAIFSQFRETLCMCLILSLLLSSRRPFNSYSSPIAERTPERRGRSTPQISKCVVLSLLFSAS